MSAQLSVHDLSGLGLSDREIQTVLSSTDAGEQTRLLRDHRGHLLEEVHAAQQRLDRLDYFIYQLRQTQTSQRR